MRRGRIFIFLALILIIGLAVVALVFRQALIPSAPAAEAPLPSVQVYIAGQNIPLGEPVTEEVLATMEIPPENVVSVMYTTDQKNQLVGKIAKYPIEQGVVITRSMVSDGATAVTGPPWASQIPQGMTAIAVPTTRLESVGFGVRDGAHVDINACFLFVDVDPSFQTKLPNNVTVLTSPATVIPSEQPGVTLGIYPPEVPQAQGRTEVESAFQQGIYVVPSEGQRPRLVCQMIVQNAVVLKLGTFALPNQQPITPEEDPQAQQAAQQPAVETPDIATLIVSPQDSITVSYLMYSGAKINLSLRNSTDDSRVATEAATLQFLLSQYNIPVPAKLPYSMEPRINELFSPFLPNDVVTVTPEEQ